MNRRDFVSRLAAAGLLPGALPGCVWGRPAAVGESVGIQLYTVRSLMSRDPGGTLKALAQIGYREVELHSLYRLTATEFRRLLDDAQLTAPATHVSLAQLRTNLDQVLEDARTLRHRWLIVPWIDQRERSADGFRSISEFLNRIGPQVEAVGFKLGYHNHEFEFKLPDGTNGLELLLRSTDPRFVDFELDLFWARRGGADPTDYFRRFPARFAALHAKDMAGDGTMVNVGAGVIDFARILEAAGAAGVKHFFVEHDNPPDPLNDVRASFARMRELLTDQRRG